MSNNDEADDIFVQLGLIHLPVDQKIAFLKKLEIAAQDRIMMLILGQLSDEDCGLLEKKLKKKATEQEVLVFLKERIEDLEAKIQKSIDLFKSELVSTVKSLDTDISDLQKQIHDKKPATKKQVKADISDMDAQYRTALKQGRFEDLPEILNKAKKLKKKIQSKGIK